MQCRHGRMHADPANRIPRAGRMDEVPPSTLHGPDGEPAKGGSFCAMKERGLNVYDLDASKAGTSSRVQSVVQGSSLETPQTGP